MLQGLLQLRCMQWARVICDSPHAQPPRSRVEASTSAADLTGRVCRDLCGRLRTCTSSCLLVLTLPVSVAGIGAAASIAGCTCMRSCS